MCIRDRADTLSHMSDEGFNDFYIGDISKSIVETLKNEGGHATQDDFNGYDLKCQLIYQV